MRNTHDVPVRLVGDRHDPSRPKFGDQLAGREARRLLIGHRVGRLPVPLGQPQAVGYPPNPAMEAPVRLVPHDEQAAGLHAARHLGHGGRRGRDVVQGRVHHDRRERRIGERQPRRVGRDVRHTVCDAQPLAQAAVLRQLDRRDVADGHVVEALVEGEVQALRHHPRPDLQDRGRRIELPNGIEVRVHPPAVEGDVVLAVVSSRRTASARPR